MIKPNFYLAIYERTQILLTKAKFSSAIYKRTQILLIKVKLNVTRLT